MSIMLIPLLNSKAVKYISIKAAAGIMPERFVTDFMYEQDYMLRIVKDLVRALAKIFLNKEAAVYELMDEKNYTHTDYLHMQLLNLIKQGEINEAENLLFEGLDPNNKKYIELALDFYSRLSDLHDDFLEKSNFSREEIEQGLKAIAKEFGALL